MSKTAKPKKSSTFGSRLTSVVSVALTLVVIGLLAQTGIVARRVTDDVRNKLTVTVYGTEISVAVYKRIMHRPFLSHINQSSVNGTITMGMILTHCITDNTCTFTMRFVRSVI